MISNRFVLLILVAWISAVIISSCRRESGSPELYTKYCSYCHGTEGEGLRSLYPALKGSAYLGKHIERLPCLLANGVKTKAGSPGKSSKMVMPTFKNLGTEEMTELIVYLRATWGTGKTGPSQQEVETWLRNCP